MVCLYLSNWLRTTSNFWSSSANRSITTVSPRIYSDCALGRRKCQALLPEKGLRRCLRPGTEKHEIGRGKVCWHVWHRFPCAGCRLKPAATVYLGLCPSF